MFGMNDDTFTALSLWSCFFHLFLKGYFALVKINFHKPHHYILLNESLLSERWEHLLYVHKDFTQDYHVTVMNKPK